MLERQTNSLIMRFFKKIILSIFLMLSVSCQKEEINKDIPQIFVSISPYQMFIGEITRGFADVKTIVPKGQNPHFFSPSIKEVSTLNQADMLFLVEESFEEKILPSILEKNPNITLINLTKTISLIPIENDHAEHCNCNSHMDIHLWLSPKVVEKQLSHIEKALTNKFPENRSLIQKRTKVLKEKMRSLEENIKKLPLKDLAFFSSHEAFAYFCRDFDCQEYALEMGQKAPTAKHLEELIKLSKEKNIRSMVIIPHMNDQGAKVLGKKLNLSAVVFDPYAENYFENLYTLAKTLKEQADE